MGNLRRLRRENLLSLTRYLEWKACTFEHLNKIARDQTLTGNDAQQLSQALARLTVEIRKDLIGEEDLLSSYPPERIRKLVLLNESEATPIKFRDLF